MSYSGAAKAREAREMLGRALAGLQLDPTLPPEVGPVSASMAQAVGSLFVAETAPNDVLGASAVKTALGLLGQALAQMQLLPTPIPAIEASMGTMAHAMGLLFPLTAAVAPAAAPAPAQAPAPAAPPPPVAPAHDPLEDLRAEASVPSRPASRQKAGFVFGEVSGPEVSITSSGGAIPYAEAHAPASAKPASAPTPAARPMAMNPKATLVGTGIDVRNIGAAPAGAFSATAPQGSAVGPAQPSARAHAHADGSHAVPVAVAPVQQAAAPYVAPQTPAASPAAPATASAALGYAQRPAPVPDASPVAPQPAAPPQPVDPSHSNSTSPAAFAATTPAPTAPALPASFITHAAPYVPAPPPSLAGRKAIEVNIGLRTKNNFWVGFDDEIGRGGAFLSTYSMLPIGTPVSLTVTLPKGAAFTTAARVRFVRELVDGAEVGPGLGFAFESLSLEHRDAARRFSDGRPPLFFDEG